MAEIQSLSTISRNPDIVAVDGETELVMLSVSTGSYFSLTAFGRVIWNLLETPRKVDELVEQLLDLADVDEKTCREDTVAFLATLADENLIDVT